MRRRSFLATVAGSAVAGRRSSAAETVNVAVVGIRGQGRSLARGFARMPDVRILYLCDVDERVYPRTAKEVEEQCGKRPPLITDLRRALDDKSVDAVVIATPDHWHAPATILACQAGKDVYVEKPASHNLREGRLMVEAARRSERIVQLGTQSRSRLSTRQAVEFTRSGKIGRVLMAKAWNVQLREDIGHREDASTPPGVDYDTWVGPAPFLPFNENRFHYKWHWHWNFGTGDIGNDGVHQLDIARWALGVETPSVVTGMGRKLYFDDDQQTPDTANLTFDFGDKALQFEMRIWNPYGMEGQDNGVAVYGSEGMVQIGRWQGQWGYRVYDSKGRIVQDETTIAQDDEDAHQRNFIDCVRSRRRPNAEIETGHTSTILCHLGNIVARTGRAVRFDARRERIAEDAEADGMLKREYRRHWASPSGV